MSYVFRGDPGLVENIPPHKTLFLLVRRRVVNNLHARLREYKAILVKEGRYFRRYLFDEAILDKLTAIISSVSLLPADVSRRCAAFPGW